MTEALLTIWCAAFETVRETVSKQTHTHKKDFIYAKFFPLNKKWGISQSSWVLTTETTLAN